MRAQFARALDNKAAKTHALRLIDRQSVIDIGRIGQESVGQQRRIAGRFGHTHATVWARNERRISH